jgi:hypothetical protein
LIRILTSDQLMGIFVDRSGSEAVSVAGAVAVRKDGPDTVGQSLSKKSSVIVLTFRIRRADTSKFHAIDDDNDDDDSDSTKKPSNPVSDVLGELCPFPFPTSLSHGKSLSAGAVGCIAKRDFAVDPDNVWGFKRELGEAVDSDNIWGFKREPPVAVDPDNVWGFRLRRALEHVGWGFRRNRFGGNRGPFRNGFGMVACQDDDDDDN